MCEFPVIVLKFLMVSLFDNYKLLCIYFIFAYFLELSFNISLTLLIRPPYVPTVEFYAESFFVGAIPDFGTLLLFSCIRLELHASSYFALVKLELRFIVFLCYYNFNLFLIFS